MIRAAVIFVLVYAGLVATRGHRPLIAWAGIVLAMAVGALSPAEIFHGINWNVAAIFFGSLLMAELFIYSRLPEAISDILINRSPDLGRAFILIIIFASIFSIFMDNVVTVLIIAPIALQLTRKTGVSPVPVIIGLAVASNLQGMAILIGDTPSMLLAAEMKLSFLHFFWYQGRPGIFWIVEMGAAAGFVVIYLFFRGDRQRPERIEVTPVRSWIPLWLILAAVVILSFMTVVDPGFTWFGGTVCLVIGAGGMIWYKVHSRKEGGRLPWKLDWGTLFFLMAVFVLVHMMVQRGAIDTVVTVLAGLEKLPPFWIYTAIVWFSVAVSAFIDNIPYIAAMLPVVTGLAQALGMNPALLAFGVLVGSCMGGNITPIGAAANLVAIGILKKEGAPVSFAGFLRIGLPFTVAATSVSWIALWMIYS